LILANDNYHGENHTAMRHNINAREIFPLKDLFCVRTELCGVSRAATIPRREKNQLTSGQPWTWNRNRR